MSKRVSVKMPDRAKPDALQAYVEQGREDAPAEARTTPRTTREGKAVRLNIEIPPELHRGFKMACAGQGVTISEVVTQLVQEWTDKHR